MQICYLCGKPILPGEDRTEDHVVPSTLIHRTQPKAKGFDYAGKLPTHQPCNNHFGDETYVAKALKLLSVLHSPEMAAPLQHSRHADISILALDASKLADFTERDLRFFKLIDGTQADVADFSDPAFYGGRQKTNPIRLSLPVVLSVLAKSAGALLVKRHLAQVPGVWRIYAHAYVGDLSAFDLSELLGESQPFDHGLRAWVAPLPHGNWQVIYVAKDTLYFFTYAFDDRKRLVRELLATHGDADTWVFIGTTLNQLMTAGWRVNP